MKAILCKAFGPIENLAYEEVGSPVLRPRQVRVAIEVSSVGFMDALMVKGEYQLKPPLPYIPGACGAGIVTEIGSEVTKARVGDRVSFLNYYGAFAEEIATDEHTLSVLPTSMDFEQAATYRLSYSPAYLALKYRAALKQGETFVITGAAGGVGLAATRLAKVLGARVIAVVGSAGKRDAALEAGADEVVDHSAGDLREQLLALTGGKGADVILDVVGGDVFDACVRCIARNGRIVVMGFTSGRIPQVKVNRFLLKNASLLGVWLGDFMTHHPADFERMNGEILDLAAEGKLPIRIAARYPLPRLVDAMNHLLSRDVIGKIVVTASERSATS